MRFLALWLAFSLFPVGQQPQVNKSASHNAQSDNRKAPSPNLPVHIEQNQYFQSVPSENKAQNNYYLLLQLGLFVATFFIALISLFQAIYLRKSVNSIISKERARIEIEPVTLILPYKSENCGAAAYKIRVRGVTDALIIEAKAHVTLNTSRVLERISNPARIDLPKSLYPRTEDIKKMAYLWTHLGEEEIDRIDSGDRFVHLWGWIRYRDVFDGTPEHRTDFQYLWENYPPSWGSLLVRPPAHWIENGGEENNQAK